MNIREATAGDANQVLELAQLFLETSSYRAFAGTRDHLVQLFDLVREHGVILVAEEAFGIVGFIALAAVPHPFNGELYAEELAWFVHPDRRGTTAGPRLLAAAEEWTRQRQLFGLKMGAPADEPPVGLFYMRHGYQAIETSYLKRF